MQVIPLETLPKQEFSIRLVDRRFVIGIRETAGVMSVSVERDGVQIVTNNRAVASQMVMPYDYQTADAGNFAFLTLNDELPWWESFNTTQQLIFASLAEIEAVRNGTFV